MTLKYESELLFDLMKRDGDVAPSDVLPYESELKEKYLNQVVGAYPKLQDYRPEWLNYNLYHHIPSDFPVESVANVTSASFNNVVPYAYRSAILKGNTLVNLITNPMATNVFYPQGTGSKNITIYDNYKGAKLNFPNGIKQCLSIQFNKMNTIVGNKYLLECDCYNGTSTDINLFISSTGYSDTESICFTDTIQSESSKHIKVLFTLTTDQLKFGHNLYTSNVDDEYFEFNNIRIIEYQEGMENWDIPYFEGVTSCKMPVLTTTGKNLFNGILTVGSLNTNGSFNNVITDRIVTDYIKLGNGTFTESNADGLSMGRRCIYDKDKNFIRENSSSKTFTLSNNEVYIRTCYLNTANINAKIQIEKGTQATSYEPYKSNILSTSEDVVLRGIGEVQDELNCLTGEHIQRVGEVVLDGSESWTQRGDILTNTVSFATPIKVANNNTNIMCDRFKNSGGWSLDEERVWVDNTALQLHISKNKATNINELRTWLSNNNVRINFKAPQEVVKTVDLTVTNQDGNTESIIRPIEGTMHVSTSSQTLPPLLDMSVPVEATSQNLMSFANIVEEE